MEPVENSGILWNLAEGAPPNIETQFPSLIVMLKAIGAPALLDVGQLRSILPKVIVESISGPNPATTASSAMRKRADGVGVTMVDLSEQRKHTVMMNPSSSLENCSDGFSWAPPFFKGFIRAQAFPTPVVGTATRLSWLNQG